MSENERMSVTDIIQRGNGSKASSCYMVDEKVSPGGAISGYGTDFSLYPLSIWTVDTPLLPKRANTNWFTGDLVKFKFSIELISDKPLKNSTISNSYLILYADNDPSRHCVGIKDVKYEDKGSHYAIETFSTGPVVLYEGLFLCQGANWKLMHCEGGVDKELLIRGGSYMINYQPSKPFKSKFIIEGTYIASVVDDKLIYNP